MRRRAVLGLLVAAGTATACESSDDRTPAARLRIATAAAGQAYERLGSALAAAARRRWGSPVEVLTTGGSVDNVARLAAGEADVAFTTVDVAAVAAEGNQPFGAAVPMAALASLYDDYLQIVVRADDAGLQQLTDLRTAKVSTGPVGTGVDLVATRVLRAAGLLDSTGAFRVAAHLAAPEAAAALRNGTIDAFFVTGGLPDDTVAALADTTPVRLLPVVDGAAALRERFGDSFVTRAVPAGTYGIRSDVLTLGVRTVLLVSPSMPDGVAYQLVRLLFEARADLERAHAEARRLDPRSAIATFPVDLHPGVRRYYREAKPMT